MFPPQKRWHVFCQAGLGESIQMLNKLIANLPASSRAAAKQNSVSLQRVGSALTASRQPVQQGIDAAAAIWASSTLGQADAAEGWQAVSGLIKAIWDCFRDFEFDDRHQVDGYKNFADAALAFDQPEIALEGYKCMLEVCVLELVLALCTHQVSTVEAAIFSSFEVVQHTTALQCSGKHTIACSILTPLR